MRNKTPKIKSYSPCRTSKKYSPYSTRQLLKGQRTEFEHTKNKSFACKIAKDHLKENSNYYKRPKPNSKNKEYIAN